MTSYREMPVSSSVAKRDHAWVTKDVTVSKTGELDQLNGENGSNETLFVSKILKGINGL